MQILTKSPPPVGTRVLIEPGVAGSQARLQILSTSDRTDGNPTPASLAQPKPAGQGQNQLPVLRPGATVSATRLPLPSSPSSEFTPTAAPSSPGSGPANPQAGTNGAQFRVRIVSVTPQQSAESSPAEQARASGTATSSVFTRGSLVSSNPGQATIVRTPTGLLELGASTSLRPGALLTVQVLEPMITSGGTTVRSAGSPHDVGQAVWRSLDPVMAALKSMTGEGKHSMTGMIPTDQAGVSVVLLRFLSALKSADVHAWLGDDGAERLIARSPEAFLDVFEEFQMFGRLAQQDGPGDWRQFWLPLLTDGQLAQIRFFERKRSAPQQDGQTKSSKRQFVFDVTLSQLGRIQLDGAFEQNQSTSMSLSAVTHPLRRRSAPGFAEFSFPPVTSSASRGQSNSTVRHILSMTSKTMICVSGQTLPFKKRSSDRARHKFGWIFRQ